MPPLPLLCLIVHYCRKGCFCLQSVIRSGAHLTIERMTLRRTCSGLCRERIMNVIAATLCGYFPVGSHQDFSSLCVLVITDLRLPRVQGQLSQPLYGHLSALWPWFVVSRTALLPLLADPRIKSSAHKCQMIDLRTGCVFPPTSAEMLIMLIYYYWFQFPGLYLLEAVPLKLQPHRTWIKIPGITNAFQLCLQSIDFWMSNAACVKVNELQVMPAFCLARLNPAARLLAGFVSPRSQLGWSVADFE